MQTDYSGCSQCPRSSTLLKLRRASTLMKSVLLTSAAIYTPAIIQSKSLTVVLLRIEPRPGRRGVDSRNFNYVLA